MPGFAAKCVVGHFIFGQSLVARFLASSEHGMGGIAYNFGDCFDRA
jgi:hypothetical protein